MGYSLAYPYGYFPFIWPCNKQYLPMGRENNHSGQFDVMFYRRTTGWTLGSRVDEPDCRICPRKTDALENFLP
jgi:hypothetical protein